MPINPLIQVWARVLNGVWVSLFRYEETDTPKPANGTGKVPLRAEPPRASVMGEEKVLPSSLPEKRYPCSSQLVGLTVSGRDGKA